MTVRSNSLFKPFPLCSFPAIFFFSTSREKSFERRKIPGQNTLLQVSRFHVGQRARLITRNSVDEATSKMSGKLRGRIKEERALLRGHRKPLQDLAQPRFPPSNLSYRLQPLPDESFKRQAPAAFEPRLQRVLERATENYSCRDRNSGL